MTMQVVCNTRIYTDGVVQTGTAVVIDNGVIEGLISDDDVRNYDARCVLDLSGCILSPGLIDLCCPVPSSLEGPDNATIDDIRRTSIQHGVTHVALVAPLRVVAAIIGRLEVGDYAKSDGAEILGYRVQLDQNTHESDIELLRQLLIAHRTSIVDIGCPITARVIATVSTLAREHSIQLCAVIPPGACDVRSPFEDTGSALGAAFSVSIVTSERPSRIPTARWIELRLPTSATQDCPLSLLEREVTADKFLIGNWRSAHSDNQDDLWARLRRDMYFSRWGNCEYLQVNDGIRFLNRRASIPMNRVVAMATKNAAAYVHRPDLGRIAPGYSGRLTVLSRKFSVLQVLGSQ